MYQQLASASCSWHRLLWILSIAFYFPNCYLSLPPLARPIDNLSTAEAQDDTSSLHSRLSLTIVKDQLLPWQRTVNNLRIFWRIHAVYVSEKHQSDFKVFTPTETTIDSGRKECKKDWRLWSHESWANQSSRRGWTRESDHWASSTLGAGARKGSLSLFYMAELVRHSTAYSVRSISHRDLLKICWNNTVEEKEFI